MRSEAEILTTDSFGDAPNFTTPTRMPERTVISGATAGYISFISGFISPLKWFMLAALILVLVDLRFGIQKAKANGEEVRASRAGRRTINKIVDYFCWVVLAGVLGQAFGEPLGCEEMLPVVILLVIYGLELNSCFNNYFTAHGINREVNVFKYFASKTSFIMPEKKRRDKDGRE